MHPMTVQVTIKNVYGKRAVYPACETAEKLCRLLAAKTFTDQAIAQLKDLGYAFTVVQDQRI